jgi:hypothetical protein
MMRNNLLVLTLVIVMMLLNITGCKDDGVKQHQGDGNQNQQAKSDYDLLFIGNSHSSYNNLPDLVATLIKTGLPNKTTYVTNTSNWAFLADRIGDGVTQSILESRDWTHVFLQAQKYSTSGLYSYPTSGAEEWIRRVKVQGAAPILFPEWPRRGNYEEGLRVHELHLYIASQEPACVAPVGLAWDASIAEQPNLLLHAGDGNHSNLKGALLTAYVFYQVLTGKSASELPFVDSINVTESEQKILRDIAAETVQANLCPSAY